jgi:hypothetical protein
MFLNSFNVSVLLFRVQKDGNCTREDMKLRLQNSRGMEEGKWKWEANEILLEEFTRKMSAKVSAYIFFSVQLVYL